MYNAHWYVVFLAALIPLVTGSIWYSKGMFGNMLKRMDRSQQEIKHSPWIFLFTYILGVMLAVGMMPVTIHQLHILSTFANDPSAKMPGSPLNHYITDFMSQYGHNFRTFKHGAFHGTLVALFIALPVIGIIAMFEGKKFKYIAVHTGYWILTFALVGGVVCQFL